MSDVLKGCAPKALIMRMLLINQNPVVSKLANLSAKKSGVEIVEKPSLDALEEENIEEDFDVLFIDNAKLVDADAKSLKSMGVARKIGLIYSDEQSRMPGFDYYLKKPFLPTEMVELMGEIKEDLLLPEMDGTPEEEGGESDAYGQENVTVASEEDEEEPVEIEEEASAEVTEEDFSALLEDMELPEVEPEVENEELPGTQETYEEVPEEEDFDALLEALDNEEDEEALLEAIDEQVEEVSSESETSSRLPELPSEESEKESGHEIFPEEEVVENEAEADYEEEESKEAEEETISLPEPEEEALGVLDEEMVSEVKELLGEGSEEPEETIPEPEEELQKSGILDESIEAESLIEEENPKEEPLEETSLQEQVAKAPEVETKENSEVDEFAQIDEAELGALLGEEIGDDIAGIEESPVTEASSVETSETLTQPEPVKGEAAEEELVTKMLRMEPEALRKLLAGAQITINITFPKED